MDNSGPECKKKGKKPHVMSTHRGRDGYVGMKHVHCSSELRVCLA